MGLFKGDAVKRVNKLMDKGEVRRKKLHDKIVKLKEDENLLYQAVQDDFNEAILDDREVNKKLSTDLAKVREELKEAQFQLSQIDVVIQAELEKAKAEVDKERMEFVSDKKAEFNKQFDKMNQLKLEYLQAIIEYSKMNQEYQREYRNTFRDIENRVGLRNRDPYYDFHISLNQRYQTAEHYNPMVYNDELAEALGGKLLPLTERNKDKFKN